MNLHDDSMSKRAPLTFTSENVAAKPAPLENVSTIKTANDTTANQANDETAKLANTQTKKGRSGRQFIAAHVLPEAAKQFKLLAVQSNKTTQDLLIEAINDLFAKHGLSRIAD